MTKLPRINSRKFRKPTTFFQTRRSVRFLIVSVTTTTISIPIRRLHPGREQEPEHRDSTFQVFSGIRHRPAPRAAQVFGTYSQTSLAEVGRPEPGQFLSLPVRCPRKDAILRYH